MECYGAMDGETMVISIDWQRMTLWIDTAVHRMWQPATRKIASTGSIRGMDGWNRILEYKQSAQRQTGSDSGYRVYSLDFPKTLLPLSLPPSISRV
jgi:hypothetical protein